MNEWYKTYLRDYVETHGRLIISAPAGMGDCIRWIWTLYNTFDYFDWDFEFEIHFYDQKAIEFFAPLLDEITFKIKLVPGWVKDFPYFSLHDGRRIGYKPLPIISSTERNGLVVARKRLEAKWYTGYTENLSHRIYHFEMYEDTCTLIRSHYKPLLQLGDKHLVYENCSKPASAREIVRTIQQSELFFGEVSFGHQIAICTHSPFLVLQTDCNWTLVAVADLIFDLKSRNIVFQHHKTLLDVYHESRDQFLDIIDATLEGQKSWIKNVSETPTTGSMEGPEEVTSMVKDSLSYSTLNLDFFVHQKPISKFVFTSSEKIETDGEMYNFFATLKIYRDLIQQINYLCHTYKIIQLREYRRWGHIESSILRT